MYACSFDVGINKQEKNMSVCATDKGKTVVAALFLPQGTSPMKQLLIVPMELHYQPTSSLLSALFFGVLKFSLNGSESFGF